MIFGMYFQNIGFTRKVGVECTLIYSNVGNFKISFYLTFQSIHRDLNLKVETLHNQRAHLKCLKFLLIKV